MNGKYALCMRKPFLDKKALSPAIAVALLLAITIALVAAVSYTATNLNTTPERSPQGVFAVQVTKDFGLVIRQVSGDPIYTGNLKLIVEAKGVRTETVPNKNNTFYAWGANKCTSDGTPTIMVSINKKAAPNTIKVQVLNSARQWVNATYVPNATKQIGNRTYQNFTLTEGGKYLDIKVISAQGVVFQCKNPCSPYQDDDDAVSIAIYEYNSPWLQTGELPEDVPEIRFGQYTTRPGSVMKALNVWAFTDDIHGVISNWDELSVGDTVKIMMVYTPTNQVIWQGEVVVG
ncbi:MAG: type IV pilin [Candidatus Bathyarchaeota archaeon]